MVNDGIILDGLRAAHRAAMAWACARSSSLPLLALVCPQPAPAQELPVGQSEADYARWLDAQPGRRGQILSFEAWQAAAGVRNVLPTWQMVRTASMWRECGGEPFEVPPFTLWPGMVKTLRFIRDHVMPAVGPVEAVSGYRNPALNACAHGAPGSAHRDFFAIDLIPLRPTTRRQLFDEICPAHARFGPGRRRRPRLLPFTRFHIDTRSFRRWGSAGPRAMRAPARCSSAAATRKRRRCPRRCPSPGPRADDPANARTRSRAGPPQTLKPGLPGRRRPRPGGTAPPNRMSVQRK